APQYASVPARPRCRRGPPFVPHGTALPPTTATAQILVVDDDPDIRSVVEAILRGEGYQVTTASNGRLAWELISQQQPDVVLLDLQMPVMTGWEVLGLMRQHGLQVPIVVMTAGYRAKAEAERHGAAAHLAKPFDLDDLLATIERCLEHEG
ncbi:MAG: response regulator, partial [Dehalococcoidia bacterium]